MVRECNKWVYVFAFEFLLAYTTNNQLVKFNSDNGATFNYISFAAGVWNYMDDLNEHIREVTKEGDLELYARTFRVAITLKSNHQLDLTKKSYYLIVSRMKLILFLIPTSLSDFFPLK